jgi:RHS repeat-associated protein
MLISAVSNLMNQFTSKERDAETGLDYFGARYYSGAEGRFISPDPKAKSAKTANPQSWNRYLYTLNNPLKYIDPDGMDIVLAKLSDKDRAYVVNNLARLYMDPKGKAFLERADASKFTVEVGLGKLEKTNLTPERLGETILSGGKTHVTGGNTKYDVFESGGHKTLVANSPDSPSAKPIQVLIDKDQTGEIHKDPAKVLAHEIGGHTAEVLNAAESNPEQFIDNVDKDDETGSEDAEKAIGKLPRVPSGAAINAIEKMLKKKSQ